MEATITDDEVTEAEVLDDNGEPISEATRRFRTAEFIRRTSSRAGRRLITTGKAAKRSAAGLGHGVWKQISEPYSMTKQILSLAFMVGAGIGLWYVTILTMLVVAYGTGSWILGLIAACAVYGVLVRLLYLPLVGYTSVYMQNASVYRDPTGLKAQGHGWPAARYGS